MHFATAAVIFVLLSSALANGNLPGGCFLNGTVIDPNVPGGSAFGSYCALGYGRPRGVCDCAENLNSCLQVLARCAYATSEHPVFVPPIPSVIYVKKPYNFVINISYTDLTSLCFLRPFPAGLTFTQLHPDPAQYALSGTPQESMPRADYGIAASRGLAAGTASTFFSFEVQACADADATFPPVPPTTPPPCDASISGNMRCMGMNMYQTCTNGAWLSQTCQPGLKCVPSGQYIYCE